MIPERRTEQRKESAFFRGLISVGFGYFGKFSHYFAAALKK
jgi:hypothetical protein